MKVRSSLSTAALLALTAVAAFVTGCNSPNYSGSSYSREHAREAHTIYLATIVSIENVTIDGTEGVLGGIGGAVVGAALGNTIGGGSGKTVAQAAGLVGGALAGSKVEGALTKKNAIEITVKYENGTAEAIVQEPGKDFFQVGQAVRVLLNADGTKRVRP